MSDKQVSHGDSSWFDRFGKHGDKSSSHAHAGSSPDTTQPHGGTSGHASPAKGKGKSKGKKASPADPKEASHKFWVQFTWGTVIAMQLNIILVVLLLVWGVKTAGDTVLKTETNTINLVKGLQSSSQTFQASQAKARQSLLTSQAELTRSQAEKNLQQALAAEKQLALYQSQQATQRQQAQLAYAEANLADQQAKSAASQAAALQGSTNP